MGSKTLEVKRTSSYEELLHSGIRAIASKGVDHITVGDITKISHHSRPTFYTYFGDINGFLAEIWLKFGIEWLDSLLADTSELPPTSDLNSALLEILVVSHRNKEIAEVLDQDLQSWFEARTAGSEVRAVKLAWYISTKIGMYLNAPISPAAVSANQLSKYMLAIPDNVYDLPEFEDLAKVPMPHRSPMPGISKIDSDLEKLLLAAVIDVVANSGVAATSMARIARRARVSTGTIYPRYKTTDMIISASYDQAIRQIVAGNISQLDSNVGPDEYGAIVVAGFEESRKSWRNYRLEMCLEAQHNKALAQYMHGGLEETRAILDENLVKYGFDVQQRLAITHLMQNLAVGASLLFNAGVPVHELDHRIPPRFIESLLPK